MTQKDSKRAVRFRDLEDVSAFELAARWGDRLAWPFRDERTAVDELHELAVTARLADWLTRWAPIHMHAALAAGATPQQVADAAGIEVPEVADRWLRWAHGQRRLYRTTGGRHGMSHEEYEKVAAVLATGQPATGTPATENTMAATSTAGDAGGGDGC